MGMARGGGPVAVEYLLRWVAGDEAFETLRARDPEQVARSVARALSDGSMTPSSTAVGGGAPA
jgi:hypothetical protein